MSEKNNKYTPNLRFPEFTGEWEEKKLGEVFTFRNGYTPSKSEPSYWEKGKIPWFRMEDIRENGNVLYDSTQHITQGAIKGSGCFKANTIIVATSATIGEHALVKVEHLANQRFVNMGSSLSSPKHSDTAAVCSQLSLRAWRDLTLQGRELLPIPGQKGFLDHSNLGAPEATQCQPS